MSELALNATHDPRRRSWVPSANSEDADFPIQNLPFCVFRRKGTNDAPRCGVGIGEHVLDVSRCTSLISVAAARAAQSCAESQLNTLMAMDPSTVSALRAALSDLLCATQTANRNIVSDALVPLCKVDLLLPVRIGGFTDYFASIHHATNAGRLFRPEMPLLPNYKHLPVGYNGRANSVRVSGSPVRRPHGQIRRAGEEAPVFAPAQRVDHEVELGLYIGRPTDIDRPVAMDEAWHHVFGFSLLNDWSARDIQAWEYQPLGPFLAKSFATTVSPWIVTAEALWPFRTAAAVRGDGDPAVLPHLSSARDRLMGALDIEIDATLMTARMAGTGAAPLRLSRSNAATLYWSFAQMIVHHTSNGSSLDCADLLGSGTVSGATPDALGSLLEITSGGSAPLAIEATGEVRTFLEDGDEVTLSAKCRRDGAVSIGFGTCRATLLPASAPSLRDTDDTH